MPHGVEVADVDQRLEPDLRGRARRRLLGDLLEELVLTVQDRVAELLLALEVVVEAAAGDSGLAQDFRGRRTGVPGPVDHDAGGLDEPQDHLLAAVSAVPVLLHRCDASLGRVRRYLRVRQHAPGTQPDARRRRTPAALAAPPTPPASMSPTAPTAALAATALVTGSEAGSATGARASAGIGGARRPRKRQPADRAEGPGPAPGRVRLGRACRKRNRPALPSR